MSKRKKGKISKEWSYWRDGKYANDAIGSFLGKPIIPDNIRTSQKYRRIMVEIDRLKNPIGKPEIVETAVVNTCLGLSHVRSLIRLEFFSRNNPGFYHRQYFLRAGDYSNFAHVAHFGLAEPKDHQTEDENSSGLWRITQLGIDFINRRVKVPKWYYKIRSIGKGPLGYVGEPVLIDEIKNFDKETYQNTVKGYVNGQIVMPSPER